MPTFLQVENGEVLGYVTGAKVQASAKLVEADDALMTEYRTLEKQLLDAEQPGRVLYNNGRFSLPVDGRPRLSATSDKATIAADGVDTATITISVLRADGTVNTGFTAVRMFEFRSGRFWRLSFQNGVATKTFATRTSGRFSIETTPEYRLREPLHIIAYE